VDPNDGLLSLRAPSIGLGAAVDKGRYDGDAAEGTGEIPAENGVGALDGIGGKAVEPKPFAVDPCAGFSAVPPKGLGAVADIGG